jgi:hypothetical protein
MLRVWRWKMCCSLRGHQNGGKVQPADDFFYLFTGWSCLEVTTGCKTAQELLGLYTDRCSLFLLYKYSRMFRKLVLTVRDWGFHNSDYEECHLLGCGGVEFGRNLPTFPTNVLPPPSGRGVSGASKLQAAMLIRTYCTELWLLRNALNWMC